MSFTFCGISMELVSCEERVDELPIGAVRDFCFSDGSDFLEESLRIEKFILGPDIVEVGILDDHLKVSFCLRKEYGCHDESFDFLDSIFWMLVFYEPFSGNLCSMKLIFLILFCETSVMKKTGELEIFEVFSVNIF